MLLGFYAKVLHLTPGPRPVMPADGYWMYCKGQPVVHLYGGSQSKEADSTGPLDHISFRAHGLEETRSFLRSEGVSFYEAPVNGWPLHQIFLSDPCGLKLELTFNLNEESEHVNGQPS